MIDYYRIDSPREKRQEALMELSSDITDAILQTDPTLLEELLSKSKGSTHYFSVSREKIAELYEGYLQDLILQTPQMVLDEVTHTVIYCNKAKVLSDKDKIREAYRYNIDMLRDDLAYGTVVMERLPKLGESEQLQERHPLKIFAIEHLPIVEKFHGILEEYFSRIDASEH